MSKNLPVDTQKTYKTRQNTINTPAEFRKYAGKLVSNIRGILMLYKLTHTHTILNTRDCSAPNNTCSFQSILMLLLLLMMMNVLSQAHTHTHSYIYLYVKSISMNLIKTDHHKISLDQCNAALVFFFSTSWIELYPQYQKNKLKWGCSRVKVFLVNSF